MPPKGASARKRAAKTGRAPRKTPPSKAAAAAAAAAEAASPETPAFAEEAAAAADTATATSPGAVHTDLLPTEISVQVAAPDAVVAPEQAPEVTSNDGAAAGEAAVVAEAGPEAAVLEPVEGPEGASEAAETAAKRSVKKVTTKVRKVIRRVPVKRTRPAAATEDEEKGGRDGEGRQETVPLATIEQEGNPSGAGAAVSISANGEKGRDGEEGRRETGPMAATEQEGNAGSAEGGVSISVREQKGGDEEERRETEPMATREQAGNPSGAEAPFTISAEQIKTASNIERPSAPDNTTSNMEAAVSAAAAASGDEASPAVQTKKRIRIVKVRVPVKRMVKKVKVSQKEEKMEEAKVGTTTEKLNGLDSGVNHHETSKNKDCTLEVEAFTASSSAPHLPMQEDVIPQSGENCSGHGGNGENVVEEQGKGEEAGTSSGNADDVSAGTTERQKRRKTEIFIGGLDRDAKEDDILKVFGNVGEIVDVRLMMEGKTGKNKGYAFVRYATAAQAKQAVKEFTKVEVHGKQCGAAALEGNDTIFLGNIDKKWKKDDVIKLLNEIGIEKIDAVTIMPDPKNADCNRGFAFLELETNRDAQIAFKKLQKKDVFGKERNIKVAWAEPLNDPDEEEMQKVKSVYAEGIPTSWDEKKVRECFKKFGQIERVVLSRNMRSAKRKDFAFVNFTTREAALLCIESFDRGEATDKGSKVNLKVSLAKPAPKAKQSKVGSGTVNKDSSNEKPKAVQVQRERKVSVSLNKTQLLKGPHVTVRGDDASTTQELLHVLREQASWKAGQPGHPIGTTNPGYMLVSRGVKRPLSALGDDTLYSDPRGYPHARVDNTYPVAGTSYNSLSHTLSSASLPHHQQQHVRYGTGSIYGVADASRTFQMRPGTAHGDSLYSRYS